jgi:hypothetical protein
MSLPTRIGVNLKSLVIYKHSMSYNVFGRGRVLYRLSCEAMKIPLEQHIVPGAPATWCTDSAWTLTITLIKDCVSFTGASVSRFLTVYVFGCYHRMQTSHLAIGISAVAAACNSPGSKCSS